VRVLLLNQYYAPDIAATAQMLADLGSGLAAAGHEVIAVCGDRSYADPAGRYPRREVIDGVRVERVPATSLGRGTKLGRAVDYARFAIGAAACLGRLRFAAGAPPDVVVSLTTPPLIGLVGGRAAHRRNAASVLWSMDVYPDLAFALGALAPNSLAGRAASRAAQRLLRSSDAVVALGESMAERLRDAGAARVEVIHNWADGESIRPQPSDAGTLRRQWGWENRFVVGYSGNLGLAHDAETVLEAAAILRNDSRVLFAFIGSGGRFEALRARVRDRRLGNVEVRPAVERARLGELLTAVDVHLVTLKAGLEGLLVPSKIYGILAAGRPALYVGPEAGEVSRIIGQAGCGVGIRNGDAPALAREILAYAAEPLRVEQEGTRAREAFDRHYGRERGVTEFMKLLGSISPGGSGRMPPDQRI
jgi:glycosyltransferase involved in cell wall biosynthesis